jgi:tripartite-type tricarboxylate transporter receptor subunit TctC
MMITRRGVALGLAAGTLVPRTVLAQKRLVRLVVPAAAGGAIDAIGRLYAQSLARQLGENWIIENKAGANNTLGAAEVAKSSPDGTTYLTNADIQIMARHVMNNVPYDPVADFVPISRFATSPLVLVGNAAKTPGTLPELVTQLKAEPDRYNFANSALGSMGHLATESFKRRVGAQTVVINYRGTAPALTDVVSGQVPLMVAPLGSALPFIEDRSLRGFAIMSAQRSVRLPNIPTASELGLPGLEFMLWYGLWGPKGLPNDTVQRVNAAVQVASKEPDLVEKLAGLGADPVTEDPAAFVRFIEGEVQRAARVVSEAGIKPI